MALLFGTSTKLIECLHDSLFVSESELLAGQDSKLSVRTDTEEKTLTINPINTPESVGTDSIKKQGTRYFAPGGRFGALLGAVKPEDIKIAKQTAVFRPYWRVSAGYACRYLRRHSHKLPLENDVESVTIYGKPQPVTGERLRLSDLLAKAGSSTSLGYGPVKLSLGPLEGVLKGKISSVLGSRDAEMEKKVEVDVSDIVETAAYTYTGKFLFDATQSTESKEIFELLEGKDMLPAREPALKKQGIVLEPSYTREEVVEEVRKRLSKEPEESPRRIIEQEFLLSELSLIYLPSYDFTLEYNTKMRTIRLDGVTGGFKEV